MLDGLVQHISARVGGLPSPDAPRIDLGALTAPYVEPVAVDHASRLDRIEEQVAKAERLVTVLEQRLVGS
jgi:hypothetical protein